MARNKQQQKPKQQQQPDEDFAKRLQRIGGAGTRRRDPTLAGFRFTYGRPGYLREAYKPGHVEGGVPSPGQINATPQEQRQTLREARANRRELSRNLIAQAGGFKAFAKQAYGPNYEQGTLRQALRTVRQAQSQVAAGKKPATLLQSDLYKRALAQRNRLLGQRRVALAQIARRGK